MHAMLMMNICWRLFWWGRLCVSNSTLYSGWLVSMYCHLDHNNVGIMSVWNHYNSDFHWPNLIWVLDMFWRRILIVWVMNKLAVRTIKWVRGFGIWVNSLDKSLFIESQFYGWKKCQWQLMMGLKFQCERKKISVNAIMFNLNAVKSK